MDPLQNPYAPGAGSRPPALVGREAEQQRFEIAARRILDGKPEKSMMLIGLRGVGKTVLLNTFADHAIAAGYHVAQAEISEETHLPAEAARLVRRVLLGMSPREKMKDRARRALGVLAAFMKVFRIATGTVDTEALAGLADTGELEHDLADLLEALGEAAREHGTGVLFTFDEIQQLERLDLAALIMALHRVAQRQLPLMAVGAGLPSLPGLAGEARSYAERLFDFRKIDSLPPDRAAEALTVPARDLGVDYDDKAVRRIVELSDGYPYFLQTYGKYVWNAAATSPVRRSDVQRVVPEVYAELDAGFFRVRMDRVPDAERAYLRAMALLGPGPHRSGVIAAKLGKRVNQVGPVRAALIRRGVLYSPRHGDTAFTVPQFDQFLLRYFGKAGA